MKVYYSGVAGTKSNKGIFLCQGNGHLFLADEVVLGEDLYGIFLTSSNVSRTHDLLTQDHQRLVLWRKRGAHGRIRPLTEGAHESKVLGSVPIVGRRIL